MCFFYTDYVYIFLVNYVCLCNIFYAYIYLTAWDFFLRTFLILATQSVGIICILVTVCWHYLHYWWLAITLEFTLHGPLKPAEYVLWTVWGVFDFKPTSSFFC